MSIQRKIGSIIRNGFDQFEKWRLYSNSREQAQGRLRELNKVKGNTILTSELKNKITRYAETEFGDKRYSSWLELYTELRGEFIEGWIPEDYYAFDLIPEFNPQPISMLSTIKSFDHRLFPKYSLKPICVVISGAFYKSNMEKISLSELKDNMHVLNSEVVIKKDMGPSGSGIVFKQPIDVSLSDFEKGTDYVIQPAIKQHRDISRVYGNSVNTVRICTFLTKSGEVKIILKVLRMGKQGSRIDNLVGGGIFTPLNNEGRGGEVAFDYKGMEVGNKHPDTGFIYNEIKVPEFESILQACEASHYLFPYNKYIAWDVTVNNKNEVKFLEWNTRMPGFWMYEAIVGPLLNRDWL